MFFIPKEIVLLIFNNITHLVDQRALLCAHSRFSILAASIAVRELEFVQQWSTVLEINIELHSIEHYTMELMVARRQLMPQMIISRNNVVIIAMIWFGELANLQNNNGLVKLVAPSLLYETAAKAGWLPVIEYIDTLFEYGARPSSVCALAASYGHVNILRWAIGAGFQYDDYVIQRAAYFNRRNVIEWAMRSGHYLRDTSYCQWAAKGGHLELLLWMRKVGFEWDSTVLTAAASIGDIVMIERLISLGAPSCDMAPAAAALHGHAEALELLINRGCATSSHIMRNAANGGHLHCIKIAHAHGIPWDNETCLFAARNGHLDVLRWVRAHGCPWTYDVISQSRVNGKDQVLNWAIAHGCPMRR